MYQDEHGIVANSFYDRLLNKTIQMGLFVWIGIRVMCEFRYSWWRTMVWLKSWTFMDNSNETSIHSDLIKSRKSFVF